MTKATNFFFSCIESRMQDQGSLYARFHIGTFFRGQAITFANTLRRILLSEIPGITLADVVIDGATHEFATLPGVEEPVLDILLNLQKVVFAPSPSHTTTDPKSVNDKFETTSHFWENKSFQATGFVKSHGPVKVTAADLKLPPTVRCINPTSHIATVTSGEELSIRFTLLVQNPHQAKRKVFSSSEVTDSFILGHSNKRVLALQTSPMSVQKVNYVIKSLNSTQNSDYVVLEIWTDGSILPQEALQFALKNVTHFFYQFAALSCSSQN